MRYQRIVIEAVGHILASLVVFSALSVLFLNNAAMDSLVFGLRDPSIHWELKLNTVFLVGISLSLWALIYLTYRYLSLRIREVTRRAPVAIHRPVGTILTETLIVMPVYLLLTFGLGQMSINSMAGLLSTLGAYQAGRTLAVWAPEIGNDRGFGVVTAEDARNAARLSAAGVIAPVVPVSNTSYAVCMGSGGTYTNRMVAGLAATGTLPSGSDDSQGGNLWKALDGSMTFSQRGARKLALAYCATSVEDVTVITDPTSRDRQQFTAELTYRHPVSFPLVGLIFRDLSAVGPPWATTDVSAFRRSYTMTQQLSPNTEIPEGGVISNVLSGLFSNPL